MDRQPARGGGGTDRAATGAPIDVSAEPLPHGAERDAVIVATAEQQPFPANLLYRGARRHILNEGRYFRLEPR